MMRIPMNQWSKTHNQKIRYLAAGMWNTLFGYAIYALCCRLANGRYFFALSVSQILGTTNAFLSYKHFVFKTRGDYLREYFRFSLVYWVLFVFNLIALPLLIKNTHIGPIEAQGLILPVTVILGYLVHNRFSFKGHSTQAMELAPSLEERLAIALHLDKN